MSIGASNQTLANEAREVFFDLNRCYVDYRSLMVMINTGGVIHINTPNLTSTDLRHTHTFNVKPWLRHIDIHIHGSLDDMYPDQLVEYPALETIKVFLAESWEDLHCRTREISAGFKILAGTFEVNLKFYYENYGVGEPELIGGFHELEEMARSERPCKFGCCRSIVSTQ